MNKNLEGNRDCLLLLQQGNSNFSKEFLVTFIETFPWKKKMHLPNGGTIATRNKTAQASLAWLVRFSMHITWRRWHEMRWNARTVSRDRSRASECSSLEISRFKRSLSFSSSLSVIARILISRFARRGTGRRRRTARMLRAVQRGACTMAIRSTTSPIVRCWRHSPEIEEDCHESHENPRSYHKETLLQIPSFLLIHRTIRLLIEEIIRWLI